MADAALQASIDAILRRLTALEDQSSGPALHAALRASRGPGEAQPRVIDQTGTILPFQPAIRVGPNMTATNVHTGPAGGSGHILLDATGGGGGSGTGWEFDETGIGTDPHSQEFVPGTVDPTKFPLIFEWGESSGIRIYLQELSAGDAAASALPACLLEEVVQAASADTVIGAVTATGTRLADMSLLADDTVTQSQADLTAAYDNAAAGIINVALDSGANPSGSSQIGGSIGGASARSARLGCVGKAGAGQTAIEVQTFDGTTTWSLITFDELRRSAFTMANATNIQDASGAAPVVRIMRGPFASTTATIAAGATHTETVTAVAVTGSAYTAVGSVVPKNASTVTDASKVTWASTPNGTDTDIDLAITNNGAGSVDVALHFYIIDTNHT